MKKSKKLKEDNAGLFIPAGLFIGLGTGFLINEVVAGVLLGLGIGFLAMAITKSFKE